MPVKKTPPYRTLIRNLLASEKLSKGERSAFERLQADLAGGAEIENAQKLWVETLNSRYLSKAP
jgi:hypothetical protein